MQSHQIPSTSNKICKWKLNINCEKGFIFGISSDPKSVKDVNSGFGMHFDTKTGAKVWEDDEYPYYEFGVSANEPITAFYVTLDLLRGKLSCILNFDKDEPQEYIVSDKIIKKGSVNYTLSLNIMYEGDKISIQSFNME